MNRLFIFFVLVAGCFCAQAALPPDSMFRRKDIYEYRQRKLAEYEQTKVRHEERMIARDRTVRELFASSPWSAPVGRSVKAGALPGQAARMQNRAGTQDRRWIIGICSLLLIGGGAWLVRIVTETEADR